MTGLSFIGSLITFIACVATMVGLFRIYRLYKPFWALVAMTGVAYAAILRLLVLVHIGLDSQIGHPVAFPAWVLIAIAVWLFFYDLTGALERYRRNKEE